MAQHFLSRAEAAEYVRSRGLPCAKTTLAKLATLGGGPKFRKFGERAAYTSEWLDEWIESRLSEPVESTSALRPSA